MDELTPAQRQEVSMAEDYRNIIKWVKEQIGTVGTAEKDAFAQLYLMIQRNELTKNQLAQAYLFCGPRGIGKTTCARIFAKTINCFNLSDSIEACNKCESCESFIQNRSYNIHELDAASNNSTISDDTSNVTLMPASVSLPVLFMLKLNVYSSPSIIVLGNEMVMLNVGRTSKNAQSVSLP